MKWYIKGRTITAIIGLFLVITLLSACTQNKTTGTQVKNVNTDGKNINIVTSFYPMYVFTQNITKDIPGVSVANLTGPQTGCLHDYQLTPADLKTLEKAQIFVINGSGMESFIDKVIKQLPHLKIVEASKEVELLKEVANKENLHADEELLEVNPHVWVSISGAIAEVKNIGEQLATIDPVNSSKYQSNTDAYVQKLEAQKEKMQQALANVQNKDIVTFHEAFPYFAKEFNLNIIDVIEREPGSEPSAGELAAIIDTIKETKVKALFAEPQYSAKSADTIARETGAKVYILDPVVTGPTDDPDAYLKAMDVNLNTLKEALQ